METRANFVLIGVFTLAAILGTLGFFVWLASVQVNQQYTSYGILFEDVSGLDPSGDVLFNGISVGRVIGLRIAPDDPSKVLTTIEVASDTPVRSDTVARLQSQGVTGVAYISLSGGTPAAPPLIETRAGLPIIPSRRSTVQTLVEEAPDLLIEATRLLEQFQALTGPENQAYVSSILQNLDTSSGRLEQALTDFSDITGTVREATAQITRFTARLDDLSSSATTTLEQADGTLSAAREAFETADAVMARSLGLIDSAQTTFDQASRVLNGQIPDILAQVSQAAARTNTAIADLQERGARTLDRFAGTADLLDARLKELEVTLREANTAFLAVTEASESFDRLVDGDGTLLVAEARAVLAEAEGAIAAIETVARDDVPAIMSDLRGGVARARQAVEDIAADLTTATGRIDPMTDAAQQAISSANTLFEKAQTTLEGLSGTLAGTDATLGAARAAFDSASNALDTDFAPLLSDLRATADQINLAVTDATSDIPEITRELRALIARGDDVAKQVQQAVAQSRPGIDEFARKGLPEISRLATEARVLVRTLGDLVRRIERNPARFLLDDRVPEYRR